MKRFLMLVGVAVVAAAMYVAASPASQQSKGPSAKQFKALEKQVATLSKSLKATKKEADSAVGFIAGCLASANSVVAPVSQFGTSTDGFVFGPPDTTTGQTARTALDIDSSPSPGAFLLGVDPSCVNSSAVVHQGTRGFLHGAVRKH
jgi:hypothetical protein